MAMRCFRWPSAASSIAISASSLLRSSLRGKQIESQSQQQLYADHQPSKAIAQAQRPRPATAAARAQPDREAVLEGFVVLPGADVILAWRDITSCGNSRATSRPSSAWPGP
jgi:hypothetical protein